MCKAYLRTVRYRASVHFPCHLFLSSARVSDLQCPGVAENPRRAYQRERSFFFLDDVTLNISRSPPLQFACSLIPDLSNFNNQNLWTVLGEWSAASTDCALWLNGRNVGSRWDGTWFPGPGTPVLGSCAGLTGDSGNFSSDYKTFLRKYVTHRLLRCPMRAHLLICLLDTGKCKLISARVYRGGYGGPGK